MLISQTAKKNVVNSLFLYVKNALEKDATLELITTIEPLSRYTVPLYI